jgi:hypothetical protein
MYYTYHTHCMENMPRPQNRSPEASNADHERALRSLYRRCGVQPLRSIILRIYKIHTSLYIYTYIYNKIWYILDVTKFMHVQLAYQLEQKEAK